MDAWIKGLIGTALALVCCVVLLIYGLYAYGASTLPDGWPGSSRAYPPQVREIYWRSQGGDGAITVERMDPLRFVWRMYRMTEQIQTKARRPAELSVLLTAARVSVIQRNGSTNVPLRFPRQHAVEAAAAIRLSQTLSPEQIVDLALDCGYYGRDAWGLDHAAQAYFGTTAGALTAEEVVALIAIGPAPTYFSPDCHWQRFQDSYRRQWAAMGQPRDATVSHDLRRLRLRPCPPSPSIHNDGHPPAKPTALHGSNSIERRNRT